MYRIIRTVTLLALLVAGAWAWADVCVPAYWDDIPAFGEGPAGGYSAAAYLGVDARDITSDRVAALKLQDEHGVEITMVDMDAPAGKAGVKERDVILEVNGQRLESMEQLRRIIRETPPGRVITLGISRDGQPVTLKATLADRRKMSHPMPPMPPVATVPAVPAIPAMPAMSFDMPDVHVHMNSAWMGVVVENLSPQLGEYFGVRNGEGVLVNSVTKGSPADKAGLRAGDVIVRVEKERISGRADWRNALRNHRSGKVSIGVFRDHREQSITMLLPEDRGDSSFGPDFPDLDLDSLNREMEHLRPELMRASADAVRLSNVEMQRALREARVQMEREMKKMRMEMEKERKELEKQQKENSNKVQ